MVKQITRIIVVLFLSMLIFACEARKQVELDVEVDVTLDGKPAPQAKVLLDGTFYGTGTLSVQVARGEEPLAIAVQADGYVEQTREVVPRSDLTVKVDLERSSHGRGKVKGRDEVPPTASGDLPPSPFSKRSTP